MNEPSMNVMLTGTEEPALPSRLLAAGPLSAAFEGGNLRYIRYGDVEILRAISFIVRDRNWGTYDPDIEDLDIQEDAAGFAVRYRARASDAAQGFTYRVKIRGTPTSVEFHAEGEAEAGSFLTNRTGFVVLHPLAGVAGEAVTIEHVDGQVVEGRFPAIVDPKQPMMDIRALTHEPIQGLRVECRMEGGTFEMEDQRNWTDASYKTYVRPLALPWPYDLKAGERVDQNVAVTIRGRPVVMPEMSQGDRLEIAGEAGRLPQVGLGLQLSELKASRERQAVLAQLGLDILVCHSDPRTQAKPEELIEAAALARSLGAEPWLEAVIESVEEFKEEIFLLAGAVGDAFPVVLLSPASDLKSTLPGSAWPPTPPADQFYGEARRAFAPARVGGGVFSYFTEFNRKHPPVDLVDLVGFTTSAIVHAGDDGSVMESLEALPFITRSTRELISDRPYFVGPSAIGMRMNPYGEAPLENPRNIRQAMNRSDPRQRSLLGAAWTLGYYAAFTKGGAAAVVFGGTTGAHGVVHAPQFYPQPHYDEAGGCFPVFHVIRALARLSSCPTFSVSLPQPGKIVAVAAQVEGRRELLVANLTPELRSLTVPFEHMDMALLDAASFTRAAEEPDFLDHLVLTQGQTLQLGPYAVARIVTGEDLILPRFRGHGV